MKQLIIFLAIFFAFSLRMKGQIYEPGSNEEIGIFEKLGEQIPLHLKFVNESLDTVALADIIDKPTVLSFIYLDCPGICMPLLEGLSDVIEQMSMTIGEEYKVLSLSFHANDTPEKATSKKRNFVCAGCTEKNAHWQFLTTADTAAIEDILTAVGFAAKRVGNDYLHPGALIIVSPEGKITRYLYGTRFNPMDLKLALIEAQRGLARPTIYRVLEFCYSYNPDTMRYGLEITKLLGTFTFMVILIVIVILLIRTKVKKNKTQNNE